MRVRTLFLSDVHLGFKRSRAAELLAFLRGVEAECIVLVGDIIDALSLARRVFWSEQHTQVLRLLLARRRAGARLVYLPGNHDESLGMFADLLRGQMEVHREWVHRTLRGERLLVLHGDRFDVHVDCPTWLVNLGCALHGFTLLLNDGANGLLRWCGRPYYPLAERLKLLPATSVRYIEGFEQAAARHAREGGYDGVVCGHIHRATLRRLGGVTYCNTGDWVESCTAVVETLRGELQLLRWREGARVTITGISGLATDPARCDPLHASRLSNAL
jgi:UDP-2,3-diacylglucosamine pyrophosphatase LpxH